MKAAYLAGMPKIREGFYGFKNVLSITKTVSKKRIASREFVWPAIDEIKNTGIRSSIQGIAENWLKHNLYEKK